MAKRPALVTQRSGSVQQSRKAILQLLHRKEAQSRPELAEATGLRQSTLTGLVRDLIKSGVVRAIGKRESNRVGKKQELLEINPDLGWIVGAGVQERIMSLIYMDAAGGVIDRDLLQFGRNPRLIPDLLKNRIDAWKTRHGTPPGRLMGIGIGMPGVIDTNRNLVLQSTYYQISDFPLGQMVADAVGVPITLENDANCATLAESQLGIARNLDSFLLFVINVVERGQDYVVRSFGFSLFLENNLFRGPHFAVGEINPPVDMDHEPSDVITEEELIELAKPDGQLLDSLMPFVMRIAATLSDVVDLMDPQAIILAGNLNLRNTNVIGAIEAEINQRIVTLRDRFVRVRPTALMDQGTCTGAALASLEKALMDRELAESARGTT